jgi:uncharacterized membrane protein
MLGGVAAAAVALGVAMLVGIPFGAPADPRNAVGSAVVDLTPGPVKEWVIQTLGSLDKLFLAVVVLAVIATVAALAATYETRHRPIGSAIFVVAGLIACAAVLSRPGAAVLDIVPTVVGTACGVAALRLLVQRVWTAPDADTDTDTEHVDTSRRTWLAGLGANWVAGTATYSAWLARSSVNPRTSSPTSNLVTSGPSSATTPARSLPCPEGKVAGNRSCSAPRRIMASPGLIPAARTLTSTSPGAGTGRGTSRTCRTSMPPYSSN